MKSLRNRIGTLGTLAPLSGSYTILNGQLLPTPDNKRSYIDNGYSINDIVYSVVNLILDKIRVAPWGLYEVIDESSLKSYTGLIRRKNLSGKDYKQALYLRTKALQPITRANAKVGRLLELLKWPNPYETYSDNVTASCGFKLLTGDKYQWADLMTEGANEGVPFEIHNLPSQATGIIAERGFPPNVVGYQLTDDKIYTYSPKVVSHEIYWNPSWGVNQNLNGMSPLRAALKTLTRNNSAKDASSSKFQNNGLEAVLYVDDNRLSSEVANAQAKGVREKLNEEYSGPSNYGKLAISPYKMGVANLGLSPVELGIIESEKWDALLICAIYGVPPELQGFAPKTYNNLVEAEKALTSRSALPLLTSHRDTLNRKLQTSWGYKGVNVYVDFDMSVYTEMQEDIKEKVEWLIPLLDRGLPMNRALDLMGLEKIDHPYYDQPRVTTAMGQSIGEWDENEIDKELSQ